MLATEIAADAAAPSTSPLTHHDRSLLWDEGTVEILIPKGAREDHAIFGTREVHYLQFCRYVQGGAVNFHLVHADAAKFAGRQIVAEVKIFIKSVSNGLSYLYVDLIPTEDDSAPTYTLSVVALASKLVKKWGAQIFATPAPLKGALMVAPIGGKAVSDELPAFITKAPAKSSRKSDDPQLDRLLADGWKVESENGTSVQLSRTKGGKPKSMTHHRPRKK